MSDLLRTRFADLIASLNDIETGEGRWADLRGAMRELIAMVQSLNSEVRPRILEQLARAEDHGAAEQSSRVRHHLHAAARHIPGLIVS